MVESSQPQAAESMSPRQLKEASQGACSSLALCTSVIRVLCQALELTASLVHQVLAAIAGYCCYPLQCDRWCMETHLNSAGGPVPQYQIMIFIFPAFTLSPFSSIAPFQVKSLLTHSLSDSKMIKRSSA